MSSENRTRVRFSEAASFTGWCPWGIRILAVLLISLLCAGDLSAYSVLTH
jgi:hypothetical protein